MKIAAETKEEENLIKARCSVLSLVPRITKGSPNRAFRIGVSDDLFERRGQSREKGRDAIAGSSDKGIEEYPQRARFEPLVACAAAGLVIGFLLGQHSRK